MNRSYAQQWHNWSVPVFFFVLLSCTGCMLGITTKPPNYGAAFTLTTLCISLTSALSALLIFGPENAVYMRETRSGTSAAGYLAGKVLSHIPYMIMSPLMYLLFFYYTAYPPMAFYRLYQVQSINSTVY
jgi:hypothetical protein